MAEEEVEIPWLAEPVPLAEAVEALARAMDEDADAQVDLREHVEEVERRVGALEDGSSVTCSSCGRDDEVLKAGVAAARFADEGVLSEANVRALNRESHVCLACHEAFTPHVED